MNAVTEVVELAPGTELGDQHEDRKSPEVKAVEEGSAESRATEGDSLRAEAASEATI